MAHGGGPSRYSSVGVSTELQAQRHNGSTEVSNIQEEVEEELDEEQEEEQEEKSLNPGSVGQQRC